MTESMHSILVVDDEPENLVLLQRILLEEGYEVLAADNGTALLEVLEETTPDLIVLDYFMPGMSGIDVCTRLKQHEGTRNIPVIFVTAKHEPALMAEAFEAGAVDYITKPFTKVGVLARVRTHLRLYDAMRRLETLRQMALDCNALTGLPGNNTIHRELSGALGRHAPVCVVYADLDNFKPYNDCYGFAEGDRVIRFTAEVISRAVGETTDPLRFVGHVGGDDFLFFVPLDEVDAVTSRIEDAFDHGIRAYYNQEDLATGYISAHDRQNNEQHFPIMCLSMGGVDLTASPYLTPFQVSEACVAVKKRAKELQGSKFVMDRRHQ